MGAFVRTTILFIAFAGLFALLGTVVGYFFEDFILGISIMVSFAIIINIYAYLFSKRRVLKHHKVKIITEAENPRLYNIVKNIAAKAGLPMPQVGITNTPAPNAFATGRGPKDAAVVATSGLLSLLNDEELEGVMAHELAHVKNRDVMIMSIAATIAGIISFIATRLLWLGMLSGNRRDNGMGLAIAVIGAITLPLAAMLIQLSISRGREFAADKAGAGFTGKPLALASALKRIETGIRGTPVNNDSKDYADSHMWIEAPAASKKGFATIFSTHPATAARIKKLEDLNTKMNPYTMQRDPFA